MENKKKIIITISILVGCVIALIGLSFAYVEIATSMGGTAAARATTDAVGGVTLSSIGGTMKLNLTTEDINNSTGGVFYASFDDNNYETELKEIEIAKIEASDSPANTTYTCSFDVVVETSTSSLSSALGGEIDFTNTNISFTDIENNRLPFTSLTETKTYHATSTISSGDVGYIMASAKIVSSNTNDNETWLENLSGSFSVYANNIVCEKVEEENLYGMIESAADKTTALNFNIRSGATGQETNGIYTTTSTDSGAPVYFYRGAVDNNIIFGGFCWKIIRTTETHGVKLIYNGLPSNGECNNTSIYSQIGTSPFNEVNTDNAYVGYMYGTAGSNTYAATHANINNSTAKTYIENWYSDNLLSYASYIEDTVYCNDRNLVDGVTNNTLSNVYGILGYSNNPTAYGTAKRSSYYTINPSPTYVCNNTTGFVSNNHDSFTVSSSIGNGKLTYPIGLLTLDEAIFAGYNTYESNHDDYIDTDNYLYSNRTYWFMSPVGAHTGGSFTALLTYSGYVVNTGSISNEGIRPVISLKQDTKISLNGTGSAENPYVVVTD